MRRRGRPPHPDILTPREWDVLHLLREGLTNREIGGRLNISSDGAKYHVSEILSKLGLSSRSEAAGWRPNAQPTPSALPLLGWPWKARLASLLGKTALIAAAAASAALVLAGITMFLLQAGGPTGPELVATFPDLLGPEIT